MSAQQGTAPDRRRRPLLRRFWWQVSLGVLGRTGSEDDLSAPTYLGDDLAILKGRHIA